MEFGTQNETKRFSVPETIGSFADYVKHMLPLLLSFDSNRTNMSNLLSFLVKFAVKTAPLGIV